MRTRVVNIRKEPCDVYIGRPSKWGNPFVIGRDGTRAEVLVKYQGWLEETQPDLWDAVESELKGKRLGCYCAPQACHGDLLAAIAERNS